jgi:hypothetical protein
MTNYYEFLFLVKKQLEDKFGHNYVEYTDNIFYKERCRNNELYEFDLICIKCNFKSILDFSTRFTYTYKIGEIYYQYTSHHDGEYEDINLTCDERIIKAIIE